MAGKKNLLEKKLKENLKQHLVDSTALTSFATPIWAFIETCVLNMPNGDSLNARFLGTGVTYAGIGSLFSKGRDLSRRIFHVKPETNGAVKYIHDSLYNTVYNLVITPPFYYFAGVKDTEQIIAGTAVSLGYALVSGGPLGYYLDFFREMAKQKSALKRGIALSLTGAAIALTYGIYYFMQDK